MGRPGVIERTLAVFGERVQDGILDFGRFWMFGGRAVGFIPRELLSAGGWRRLLPQCLEIGTRSVPVVMVTGMFVGMVLVVQSFEQFDAAGLGDRIGALVNVSVVSELAPVLAGVMLAGRVGGALTAELGTMNVSEQLLALRAMGADPIRYLVAPRFLACLLLAPLLTCYANLMGAIGAWIVYSGIFAGDSEPYWTNTRNAIEMWDIGSGLTKSVFFGGALGMISCYKGFHCKPGAEGVGQACTQAFVISFIVILVLDFFLNMSLTGFYRAWFGFRSIF